MAGIKSEYQAKSFDRTTALSHLRKLAPTVAKKLAPRYTKEKWEWYKEIPGASLAELLAADRERYIPNEQDILSCINRLIDLLEQNPTNDEGLSTGGIEVMLQNYKGEFDPHIAHKTDQEQGRRIFFRLKGAK